MSRQSARNEPPFPINPTLPIPSTYDANPLGLPPAPSTTLAKRSCGAVGIRPPVLLLYLQSHLSVLPHFHLTHSCTLYKERVREATDAVCRITSEGLRFSASRIYYSIMVMVISLDFHSKDLDGVGDAMHVFIFPEANIQRRRCDAEINRGTRTYFSDTSLLLGCHKFSPLDSWVNASSRIEAWALLCVAFFCTVDTHPMISEMMVLV